MPAISDRYLMARWAFGVVAAAMLIASLLAQATPAQADEAAEIYVQELADEAFAILNSGLPEAERREKLRDFILSKTDARRIGLFTLGQYRRRATEAQIEEFIELFKEYSVGVYEARLDEYGGEAMKVTGSTDRSERDIVVHSEITGNPDLTDNVVNWRVLRTKTGFSIVDVEILGVWLAAAQREEFTAIIGDNNGDIDVLIAQLRDRVG